MKSIEFQKNKMCQDAVESALELLTDPSFGYASFDEIMRHAGYPGSEVPWEMVRTQIEDGSPSGIIVPVREAFFRQIKRRGGEKDIHHHPERYLPTGNYPTFGWVLSSDRFRALTGVYLKYLRNRAAGMVNSSDVKLSTVQQIIPGFVPPLIAN